MKSALEDYEASRFRITLLQLLCRFLKPRFPGELVTEAVVGYFALFV